MYLHPGVNLALHGFSNSKGLKYQFPTDLIKTQDPVSVGLGGTWDLCISHQP